jgi:hypothetical protein
MEFPKTIPALTVLQMAGIKHETQNSKIKKRFSSLQSQESGHPAILPFLFICSFPLV